MGKKADIEIVKNEITMRGYLYNFHFYKNQRLWINTTCPKSHLPENRTWHNFSNGAGCMFCHREKTSKLRRIDIEIVKLYVLERHFTYNFHFYKNEQLWINVTCPASHLSKNRRWNDFQKGSGCKACYHKNRTLYKNDSCRKLANVLRTRFRSGLKQFLKTKKVSAIKNLGCTVEEVVKYLESLFQPGMTWENHGTEWHIDHIKPFAVCDLDTVEGQQEVVHYTNLQPLWWFDNLSKGAKYSP